MGQKQIDERRKDRNRIRAEEEARRERVEGYKPIAVRDDRLGNTVISLNTETREFLISVTGKVAGPFTIEELKALKENITDVIDMQGRYLFIKEYDAYGDRNTFK